MEVVLLFSCAFVFVGFIIFITGDKTDKTLAKIFILISIIGFILFLIWSSYCPYETTITRYISSNIEMNRIHISLNDGNTFKIKKSVKEIRYGFTTYKSIIANLNGVSIEIKGD